MIKRIGAGGSAVIAVGVLLSAGTACGVAPKTCPEVGVPHPPGVNYLHTFNVVTTGGVACSTASVLGRRALTTIQPFRLVSFTCTPSLSGDQVGSTRWRCVATATKSVTFFENGE